METIRCCISCILPCGALDVVRIVHANGRVEEICGSINAGEIMRTYPKHVIKRPPVTCSVEGVYVQKPPIILPPSAELQRGKIYFLVPVCVLSEKSHQKSDQKSQARRRRKKKVTDGHSSNSSSDSMDKARLLENERYLSEIMSEKVSSHREKRRGRVAVWRPHLESITEDDF